MNGQYHAFFPFVTATASIANESVVMPARGTSVAPILRYFSFHPMERFDTYGLFCTYNGRTQELTLTARDPDGKLATDPNTRYLLADNEALAAMYTTPPRKTGYVNINSSAARRRSSRLEEKTLDSEPRSPPPKPLALDFSDAAMPVAPPSSPNRKRLPAEVRFEVGAERHKELHNMAWKLGQAAELGMAASEGEAQENLAKRIKAVMPGVRMCRQGSPAEGCHCAECRDAAAA